MASVTLESLIKSEPMSPQQLAAAAGSQLMKQAGEETQSVKQELEVKEEGGQLMRDLRSTAYECAGCKKIISDRFLLKAVDQFWHEDCLKCSCCNCRLHEQGSSLYQKDNMLLCRTDYLRLYGAFGYCSMCSQTIPASELVMKAAGKVFHLDCFKCQMCSYRFCHGDRFTLVDKLLCETCHQESRNNYADSDLTDVQTNTHSKPQLLHSLVRQSLHGGSTAHAHLSQHPQATSSTNSRILDLLQSFQAHKAAHS